MSPNKKPSASNKKPLTPKQLSNKREKNRKWFNSNVLEPRLRDIENEVDPVEKLIKIHTLSTLIAVKKNDPTLWGPTASSVKKSFPTFHKQLEDLRRSTEKVLSSEGRKARAMDIIDDTKLDSDEANLKKISAVKSVSESVEEKELDVLDKIAPDSKESTMLKLRTVGGVMKRSSEARATDKTAAVPTTTATNSPEAGERNEYHSPTFTTTPSSKGNFGSLSGILASVNPSSKRKQDDPGLGPGGRHNSSNKRRKTATAAASSHCVSFGLKCEESNERTDDGKPYHEKGRIKQNLGNSVSSQMFLEVQDKSNQKSQQVDQLKSKVEELEYRLKIRNNNPNPTTEKLQGRYDELLTSYQRNKKKNGQLQAQLEGVQFVSDQYFQALKKKDQRLCLYPRKEIYWNLPPHRYFPDPDLELLRAQNTWLDNEITQRRTLASIARRRGEKALAEQQH